MSQSRMVVHKFILPEGRNEVQLEPGARVLYAARDSREHHAAIWVLRDVPVPPTAHVRVFRVVATGEPFAPEPEQRTGIGRTLAARRPWVLQPHGLVRVGAFIFHVFEESLAAEGMSHGP